jgi:hypothetical protein
MRRTTIFANDRLLEEIKAISREAKASVARVLRETNDHSVHDHP